MTKEKNEPTIRADDFVEWENNEKSEKYTNFQELNAKFNVLKDVVDEIIAILKVNNLTRTETIEAEYYNEDKAYKILEEENE